jgi:hypothetical protein
MTKTKEPAAPAAPINPKDLPLTRGQGLDLADALVDLLVLVRSGTTFNDEQWRQKREQLRSIITTAPVHVPQPFMPNYANDEQLAEKRRQVAEERSGERLRERY